MYVHRLRVENFRCFRELEVLPRRRLNVLVGENNSGKTTLLAALEKALGPSPKFVPSDFYSSATSASEGQDPLPTLRIDVELRPDPPPAPSGSGTRAPATFSTSFQREAGQHITFDGASGDSRIILRTQAIRVANSEDVDVTFLSVRSDGSTQPLNRWKRNELRTYCPFYHASAFRDTVRELGRESGFWGRILGSTAVDPATDLGIKAAAVQINADVQRGAPRLTELKERLRRIGRVIPLAPGDESVSLDAVPLDVHDILRNLQVGVRLQDAPRTFDLTLHGEGIRSIAYLEIFRTYVDLVAKEENENLESTPILGIEEPEVHLHPHAHKSVSRTFSDEEHQTFITTHSGAVAQASAPYDLTMLRRTPNGAVATTLPEWSPADPTKHYLDEREENRLVRLLLAGGIEMVFGRTVILCEGDSERLALPVFARALGVDIGVLCISIVPVGGNGYGPAIRAISRPAFAIPWVILTDSEPTTLSGIADDLVQNGYVRESAVKTAETAGRLVPDVLEPADCFAYANVVDFETALLAAGASPEFKAAIERLLGPNALTRFIAEQSKKNPGLGTADVSTQIAEFIHHGPARRIKPLLALTVAQDITRNGTDPSRVPSEIKRALETAASFSSGARSKY